MEKLKRSEIRMPVANGEISVRRDPNGVPHVRAETFEDLFFGLGWVNACDRPVELELTRLVAKGRTAEFLKADPEMVELDRAMRRYDLWGDSKFQAECLRPETLELVQAYCDGVNRGMGGNQQPLEFRLLKHRQEAWTIADSIAILKLTGLVDLTETQGWAEKFIVQMIREGVDLERLKELFPYMIEDLNPDYTRLIRELKFVDPIIPETVRWAQLPRTMCSNNWAVAGSRTVTGKPILCGDPHLDTSRLPAIWQEVVLEKGDFYFTGVSVPGIPFPTLGRTRDLAWSATYAYMDVMDYFIEIVRDGKYRRGGEWREFDVREEVINRKNGESLTTRFYQTDLGVLEGEPDEDGYYLCFAWSAGRDSGAESLNAMTEIMRCRSVKEAMPLFARLDVSAFNWVMADAGGNIGHQMSGRCPARAEGCSGLLPMPGWDESYHWQGFLPREDNPSSYNPPEGFIVTANQDLNRHDKEPVINLCMPSYRAERITDLLSTGEQMDASYMQRMQYDLYSKQAEAFMKVIGPRLPDTPNGQLLKEWDMRYRSDSRAATLFERVYLELVKIVFGQYGVGRQVMDHLTDETILFSYFYGNFDRLLLAEDSLWMGENTRADLIRLACERNLASPAVTYGSWRKVLMKNIFFGGKLPRFLGFDYGPVELIGSRATIPQGQIFNSAGRVATYSPTWKFVADFSEEGIRSVLAGGPSDRRFSRWYKSGIKDWQAARYKRLSPFGVKIAEKERGDDNPRVGPRGPARQSDNRGAEGRSNVDG